MRLNNLHLYKSELEEYGLEEINLSRLGSVVALVGKNGSGKSRMLDTVHDHLIKSNPVLFMNEDNNLPQTFQNKLKQINKDLIQFEIGTMKLKRLNSIRSEEINNPLFNVEFSKIKEYLKNPVQLSPNFNAIQQQNQKQNLKRIIEFLNGSLNTFVKKISHKDLVSLQDTLENIEANSFEGLLEQLKEAEQYDELDAIYGSGLKFLLELPAKLAYDKMDTAGDEAKFKNRISSKRYELLKDLFYKFIGKTLTWEKKGESKKTLGRTLHIEIDGSWYINGREFNYNELSDGEKKLFSFILIFFLLSTNKEIRLSESIIFIDEPELNLHPDAEINLIEAIRDIIGKKGQLWIATHSINILSHLNQDEIFIVKNNQIFHPKDSTPENSLNELLSLEDRAYKLGEFVTNISQWSYVNFMTQCFFDPEVIDHAIQNDPQLEVFKKSIQSTNSKTLLDFGAGKGRLYERLKEDQNYNSINYFALEPDSKLHPQLNNLGVKGIYNDFKNLPENEFDQIVLCNVLHEIPLQDWTSTLNKVIKALNHTGFLVIIEDRFLPKGEKIGEIGFLLLDLPELKKLFNLKQKPSVIESMNPKYSERILCSIIKKSDLPNQIKKNNVLDAIVELKSNSLLKIEELRSNDKNTNKSMSKGRLSGLYSQLYINAVLAEKKLNKSIEP